MYKTVQFILHTIPGFDMALTVQLKDTVNRYNNIYHYFKGLANMQCQKRALDKTP